jgi:hypothetical protein
MNGDGSIVNQNRTRPRTRSMIAPVFARPAIGANDLGFSSYRAKSRQMVNQQLLSIRQAAERTGLRRKVIRDRITRGDVPVRIIGSGRGAKLRLTESALVEAGLLAGGSSPAVKHDELTDLIGLVREQQKRLNALEDQRFQLAGQLGAALERTLALQNQLIELTASVQARGPVVHEIKKIEPRAEPVETVPKTNGTGVGPEDARKTPEASATVRTTVAVRHAIVRLTTSKGAQRGKAGISRLRAIQLRPGKQEQ